MKKLIFMLFLFACGQVYSQTLEIEKNNAMERYKRGEITQPEIFQLTKDWTEFRVLLKTEKNVF